MAAEPRFMDILFNDAAIAVGVAGIQACVAPYDGYLVAVKVSGAGIEDANITTSSAAPAQHIPGTDIAIDTDALGQNQPGDGVYFMESSYCVLNQPCKANEIFYIDYPNGTGTAEANAYFRFSRSPIGNYHLWVAAEDTVAAGSEWVRLPTELGLSSVAGCLIRGAGAQDMVISLGPIPSGFQTQVLGRAIAVDTDVEPIGALHPIQTSGPLPTSIVTVSFNGYTGVAMGYFVLE